MKKGKSQNKNIKSDVDERTEIILNQAIQVFNRLDANISTFGGKISSFFQLLFALITFQVALLFIVINNGGIFSKWSFLLLFVFIILMVTSVIVVIYLLRPRKFLDIEIFKEDRFKRLCHSDKKQLLSDFLFQVKTAYAYNDKIYNENIQNLIRLYHIFLTTNIFYILLILSLWVT